jgi:Tannase-like family of unknown function (DUF6351)
MRAKLVRSLWRSDYYPVQFNDDQWAQLVKTFPIGVCDWTRPGVSQAPSMPWLSYDGAVGGKPLGPPPVSTPLP